MRAAVRFSPVNVDPSALVRVSRHDTGEPYFGRSGGCRFDDPRKSFGTCYLGFNLTVASHRKTVVTFRPYAAATLATVWPSRTALIPCWRITWSAWWSNLRPSEVRLHFMSPLYYELALLSRRLVDAPSTRTVIHLNMLSLDFEIHDVWEKVCLGAKTPHRGRYDVFATAICYALTNGRERPRLCKNAVFV